MLVLFTSYINKSLFDSSRTFFASIIFFRTYTLSARFDFLHNELRVFWLIWDSKRDRFIFQLFGCKCILIFSLKQIWGLIKTSSTRCLFLESWNKKNGDAPLISKILKPFHLNLLKPVYNGHPWDPQKVAVGQRRSVFGGF